MPRCVCLKVLQLQKCVCARVCGVKCFTQSETDTIISCHTRRINPDLVFTPKLIELLYSQQSLFSLELKKPPNTPRTQNPRVCRLQQDKLLWCSCSDWCPTNKDVFACSPPACVTIQVSRDIRVRLVLNCFHTWTWMWMCMVVRLDMSALWSRVLHTSHPVTAGIASSPLTTLPMTGSSR